MISALQSRMIRNVGSTALLYHSISKERSNWEWALDFDVFKQHMRWIKQERFICKSVREISSIDIKNINEIYLTFDDGYSDNLDALKYIIDYGLKATIFIVSENVGKKSNWSKDRALPMLTFKEIRYLSERGIEIGLHGKEHVDMCTLSNDQLINNIKDSKMILEQEISRDVISMAYPYGRYNSEVLKAIKESGIRFACTTHSGRISSAMSKHEIPRLSISSSDDLKSIQRKIILGSNEAKYRDLASYLFKRTTSKFNRSSKNYYG